jgi:hypothetical protein
VGRISLMILSVNCCIWGDVLGMCLLCRLDLDKSELERSFQHVSFG